LVGFPAEASAKTTRMGEHPDVTSAVKSAASCALTSRIAKHINIQNSILAIFNVVRLLLTRFIGNRVLIKSAGNVKYRTVWAKQLLLIINANIGSSYLYLVNIFNLLKP
jgi:hypothetical protein